MQHRWPNGLRAVVVHAAPFKRSSQHGHVYSTPAHVLHVSPQHLLAEFCGCSLVQELCFPHLATITGTFTTQVTSIMHHNPGEFKGLRIQIWNSDGVESDPVVCGSGDCARDFNETSRRTIANCLASGGAMPMPDTCVWQDTVTMDTASLGLDGWQQFRVRGIVTHGGDTTWTGIEEDMRTSTGLHAYLSNGFPVQHIGYLATQSKDFIETRGWYEVVEYTTTQLNQPPVLPVSGLWRASAEMEEGAGGDTVTYARAALNPGFHAGNIGWYLAHSH